ncbi:MAG: hypothetical protein JSR77_04675 [Planctomycetes bacterium]|nr:hypothetical protein [Planctomycetota bacterium]
MSQTPKGASSGRSSKTVWALAGVAVVAILVWRTVDYLGVEKTDAKDANATAKEAELAAEAAKIAPPKQETPPPEPPPGDPRHGALAVPKK